MNYLESGVILSLAMEPYSLKNQEVNFILNHAIQSNINFEYEYEYEYELSWNLAISFLHLCSQNCAHLTNNNFDHCYTTFHTGSKNMSHFS